ncbi:calcium-binding protein [Stagnihabitans tardus]|uniref:Calcium-binding protein n=1 Tax=Stagnihabitans tardus TaxID=2699202 RepID=A0AAE5BVC2_9RHOB|nr:calcium-binding protein [Stagnihabitans tardus]NBZ88746.1 hypothetical protein [Stagnihabitans tardus]
MTNLTLSTTTDYSLAAVTDVTLITFANPTRSLVTATINASQLHFTGVFSKYDTAVTGSAGTNVLIVKVDTTMRLAGDAFVFTSWSGADRIRFLGDGQNNYITGTILNDSISGGDGNDTMFGGASGVDLLFGDAGDDEFSIRDGRVDGGAGNDFLHLSLESLGAFTLDLRDGGGGRQVGAVTITSIEGMDLLAGNEADTLFGGLRNDWIRAANGDDLVSGGVGRDLLEGGEGNDTLLGGADADTVKGGAGADLLTGAGGGDYLAGGEGADTLTGGAGADRFVFASAGDSYITLGIDTITDFKAKVDKIDLIGLEYGAPPNFAAFFYIGQAEFGPGSGTYGEVRWFKDATTTHIEVRNPGGAVMQIDLTGLITLTREDFIL